MLFVFVLIAVLLVIGGSDEGPVTAIADFFCDSESVEACAQDLWRGLKEIWRKLTSGNIFEIIQALMGLCVFGLFLFFWLVVLGLAIRIIFIVFGALVFSKEAATNWTGGLQKYPVIRAVAFCIVFVLMVPLGIIAVFFATGTSQNQVNSDKSVREDEPVKEPAREKKNPNRTIAGSIVADAMLFDGDSEKARMAKRWRNILGG